MRLVKIKYRFAFIVILLTLITFLISFNFIPTGFKHRYVYMYKLYKLLILNFTFKS